MDSRGLSIIAILFLLFLLGTLVLIGIMFVSILRQGDERRRMILLHAGSTSFTAMPVGCCWRWSPGSGAASPPAARSSCRIPLSC